MKRGEMFYGYNIESLIREEDNVQVYSALKRTPSGVLVREIMQVTIPTDKQLTLAVDSLKGNFAEVNNFFKNVLDNTVKELQELNCLSDSESTNILKYYENIVVEEETPNGYKRYGIYVFMEHLPNMFLHLKDKRIRVRDIVNMGIDILNALNVCHQKGIAHRNICEGCIFVSDFLEYKLGNFGVTGLLHTERNELLQKVFENASTGPSDENTESDFKKDIFSLGILLYRLLNQPSVQSLERTVYEPSLNDETTIINKIIRCEELPLPANAQNKVGEVVLKAITNKNDRYCSASSFLDDLHLALELTEPDELEQPINVFDNVISDDEFINSVEQMPFEADAIRSSEEGLFVDDFLPEEIDFQQNLALTNVNIEKEISEADHADEISRRKGIVLDESVVCNAEKMAVVRNKKMLSRLTMGASLGLGIISIIVLSIGNIHNISFFSVSASSMAQIVLLLVLCASLVCSLGRLVSKVKGRIVTETDYNEKSIIKGNDAYLRFEKVIEKISKDDCLVTNVAKENLRKIFTSLKEAGSFGMGNDVITAYENEIAGWIEKIEKRVFFLFDKETYEEASKDIVIYCREISGKLRLRVRAKLK